MPQTTLNIPRETTHQRIADALEDIVDKLVDTSDADNVNYDNTTSGLSANKVQGAIDELANEKSDITYVDDEISKAISSCYHPSGSKTVAELTSALLVSTNEGNVYDMTTSGTTTSDFKEGAGYPIRVGDNVGICNVGTQSNPVYKFDLLSGFVDLSNYYTKTESNSTFVAKEEGKGLSSNDYTTAEKNKLAGVETDANKTIVDDALSDISTNPVQNKVIKSEFDRRGISVINGKLCMTYYVQ